MQQLAFSQTLTAGGFSAIALVELEPCSCLSQRLSRRGFPAVFVGVALGLMLHAMLTRCRRQSPFLRDPRHGAGHHCNGWFSLLWPPWWSRIDSAAAVVYGDAPAWLLLAGDRR